MTARFLTKIKRKTEVRVLFGRYECLVDQGLLINPPLITSWKRDSIEEYIEFLKLLRDELEKYT